MENLPGPERIHSCRGFSKQFSLGLKSHADSRQITALQGINSLKCLAFCTSKYRMYFLLEGNYFILGSWNSHKWRVAQKDENVPGVPANQQPRRETHFPPETQCQPCLASAATNTWGSPSHRQLESGPPSEQLPHKYHNGPPDLLRARCVNRAM